MRRIILLCGRKRTGKGTIYNIASPMCHNSGELFFAKPIKDFCINALGLTYDQMYGSTEYRESKTSYKWRNVARSIREKYGKSLDDYLTAREVLQVVGTDVMRNNFDPDVWAKAGAREAIKTTFDICFFTDTRMRNELFCTDNVALENNLSPPTIIRIYRDTNLEDNHDSERDLDEFDAIPNQRLISQGVPSGFQELTDKLWVRTTSTSPFRYLLDNNGLVEETEAAVKIILNRENICK